MKQKIHRIWFGNKEIPHTYENYWKAWQRQYPSCEFITWTDKDMKNLPLSYEKLKIFSSKISQSDLARYEILYHHGGMYIDCDMMPYNYINIKDITKQLTICNEDDSEEYCSIGFIASPPKNEIFYDLIHHIIQTDIDETRPNITTGPHLFGLYLKKYPYKRLATASFYPYQYNEPLSSILNKNLDTTYGIHIWGGGWVSPEIKKEKIITLIKSGDIEDAKKQLETLDNLDEIKNIIHAIHKHREQTINCVMSIEKNVSFNEKSEKLFELSKIIHWVLNKYPEKLIWQIGAADGILVDPLRNAMINFNPRALLLEPNPYMYTLLKENYKNNTRANILQRAYSLDKKKLSLNAINPQKVEKSGLPAWVLGISSIYNDKNAIGGLGGIDERTTRIIQTCIEKIEVDVVGFDELVAISNGAPPDIVVIDAEGMDKIIIDDILLHKCHPIIIHFEIQCMSDSSIKELISHLSEQYFILQFGNDVSAYRKDVLLDYAKYIYIENGFHNIFQSGINVLNLSQKT
ncbi:FkbM family methyltransferase [Gluconacetobacter sp. Hr-1-5]|uniref:FkbM family methyltransferase n=1 Tax=Gluconacetobacter sp. Hr-1-5 TaxID=3395370 RepID=UPI003B524444